ncbi:MAG: response regulator [Bacteroidota bacterium]
MKRLLGTLLAICLLLPLASAQEMSLEWLETALKNTPEGISRVDLLNHVAEKVRIAKPSQAQDRADEARKLSRKLKYAPGEARANFLLGLISLETNRAKKSVKYLEDALPWYEANASSQDKRSLYENLAMANQLLGKSKDETTYRQKALALRQQAELANAEERIDALRSETNTQRSVVESARRELEIAEQEKEEMAEELEVQRTRLLEEELKMVKLQHQNDSLDLLKAELQQENLRQEQDLLKGRLLRNWLIAGGALLLLLGLGGWQRYRFIQEKKQTRFEQQKAQRLQQVDQLKDQFLANTSHELRTPLNGIIGLAEALYDRTGNESPESQRENLSMIISSGKRLSNLVNDLLDFSKIRSNTLDLVQKPVDLQSLVEVVVRINRTMASQKDLVIENEVSSDLVAVMADEDRLMQILHNLVGNAVKFTPEGSVTIRAVQQEDWVEVSVTDTGIGVPPTKQAAIFEAFVQADGSTQREFVGTGLGLSISKRLAELHGGRMWLESEPGLGSVFYFTLPTTSEAIMQDIEPQVSRPIIHAEPQPLLAQRVSVVPENQGKTDAFRILIVDDEPINQQVLKQHLDDTNYEIYYASHGGEALTAIDSKVSFDLVLLDIMMPQMSGYEVCQRIREQYLPSQLPVIMITAKNQVEDLVAGLAHGANDYISKPFSKDELLARIKTHLNIHNINAASQRFVPSEFLSTLGYESITDVRLGDLTEKEVTVFFSDIRGYTSLAETMTPEQNFRFVNAYSRRMGPIIRKHGGFVNQYLGDGIMAIFMQGPEKAIQASVDMQKELARYNVERKANGRMPIRVGMGLHTGKLIMGIIGDSLRTDAATISDTVNTAARMEGLTKFYGANLLVSEATLASLEDPTRFNYRYLGQVQLKGKKVAIGVYEFFDADDEVRQTLKWGVQQDFERALRHYYAREFGAAIDAFEKVISIFPDDQAATRYLAHARELQVNPPGEDWSGVETMEVK